MYLDPKKRVYNGCKCRTPISVKRNLEIVANVVVSERTMLPCSRVLNSA